MLFDPEKYGPEVAGILAGNGGGERLLPLVIQSPSNRPEALQRATAHRLFPGAYAPEAALSGLWLYFSCFEESHSIAQDIPDAEGSYWHGILHRQEPDPGNAGYWFRRVGHHPVFEPLGAAAAALIEELGDDAGFRLRSAWNPFEFIEFCEQARRRPGSRQEALARRITLAEWQLLFDYCASPAGGAENAPAH